MKRRQREGVFAFPQHSDSDWHLRSPEVVTDWWSQSSHWSCVYLKTFFWGEMTSRPLPEPVSLWCFPHACVGSGSFSPQFRFNALPRTGSRRHIVSAPGAPADGSHQVRQWVTETKAAVLSEPQSCPIVILGTRVIGNIPKSGEVQLLLVVFFTWVFST